MWSGSGVPPGAYGFVGTLGADGKGNVCLVEGLT